MRLNVSRTTWLAPGFAALAIFTAAFSGVFTTPAVAQEKPPQEKPAPALRHIVLLQFKADVTKAQVQEVVEAFAALPKKIEQITDFEWGTNVSPEMKAEGFTHCFVVSFANAKDRDAYLPHPAHGEFVKLVGPRIEKVLVFDFENGR
ncbi:MAG: Dabb family protein [Pirellulaceae bacterium]